MTIINTSSAAQTNLNYAELDFVEKYENPIEYSRLSFNEMEATTLKCTTGVVDGGEDLRWTGMDKIITYLS